MSFGIEVKPQGKRKYRRLSVSMLSAQAMINNAAENVSEWCKNNGAAFTATDWRVIDRDTDSIIATKDRHSIKPLVMLSY